MKTITLKELRTQFEQSAQSSFFSIERNEIGEYSSPPTYYLWAGYWQAAVDFGHLSEGDSLWQNTKAN